MPTRHARATIAPLALLAFVGAISTDAFTASGLPVAGGGAISGYTVSGVSYLLGDDDAATITGVTFRIEPRNATLIRVRLVPGGTWYSCRSALGQVSCATDAPAVALASASRLDVQATG